ncbi:hypothetical protein XI08_12480 [Bradyrhizobium sp. CCBAU 11361]|nr:hypothetical protein [Bradyrhizobium sp. CCBAU 11361]
MRHVRCFRVVAEERNFYRAAERLHTDQSALSGTIRELEDKLDGVELFARTQRSIRLARAASGCWKRATIC